MCLAKTDKNKKNLLKKICVRLALLGSIYSLSSSVIADTAAQPQKLSTYSSTATSSQMATLVAGLLLIIVLIYGLAWFVKRFTQGGFLQNSAIKIVASLQLGTRERLALVQVGETQLLLGISATQINCLHAFETPVVALEEKASVVNSEFSQKLMSILQGKSLIDAQNSANSSKVEQVESPVVTPKKTTKKNNKE